MSELSSLVSELPSMTLLAHFPEAILVTDDGDVICWANRAAMEITGWTTDELKGMPLEGLITADQIRHIAQTRGCGDPRALTRYHCLLRTKSGAPQEVSVSVGRSPGLGPGHSVYLLRDVRRQRDVQEQLVAQLAAKQELEAFGRAASLIVHDLRSLNNVLAMTARNFRLHLDDPEFRAAALRTLEEVSGQTSDLISKLCSPPVRDGVTRERTMLGDLVRRALELAACAGRQTEVSATSVHGLEAGLECDVEADQVVRVIFHVLINAYDAVAGGGEVSVRGEFDTELAQVRLVIEDTGPGIRQEYLDRHLFRPFRSTKPEGLGLGLYQAKWVVEAQGGTIRVENRAGKRGARVTMILPGRRVGRDSGIGMRHAQYASTESSPCRG